MGEAVKVNPYNLFWSWSTPFLGVPYLLSACYPHSLCNKLPLRTAGSLMPVSQLICGICGFVAVLIRYSQHCA